MADIDTHDEMACCELVELITEYWEGALPLGKLARFEAHLAECPPCCQYLDQLRRTVHAIGRLKALPAAPAERTQLLDMFKRWRDQPSP